LETIWVRTSCHHFDCPEFFFLSLGIASWLILSQHPRFQQGIQPKWSTQKWHNEASELFVITCDWMGNWHNNDVDNANQRPYERAWSWRSPCSCLSLYVSIPHPWYILIFRCHIANECELVLEGHWTLF
jgi:hypothetical protein